MFVEIVPSSVKVTLSIRRSIYEARGSDDFLTVGLLFLISLFLGVPSSYYLEGKFNKLFPSKSVNGVSFGMWILSFVS